MLKVGETKEIKVMLLDDDGNPTTGTIAYTVYDENDASFATGNMSAVSGVTGLYTMSFTPDAAGAWSVLLKCSSPNRTAVKMFDVGVGVEQASYDAIVVLDTALNTHDTDIKLLIAALNDIAAADVWNYVSRTLTAHIFPFTNPAGPVDLSNVQTAAYGRLGAPVGASISVDIAAIKTVVDSIEGYVDTEVAAIKGETDKIPRIVTHMDFKSLPLQITLTSVAGDRGLVDIVVSGLPAGATIIAVEGIFYCDTVENTFAGVNFLKSTKIQVKKKVAGTDRDAIILEANKIFRFTSQVLRGGTVLTADWATATAAGILTEVSGNGTYQMWFDVGESSQDNIVLDGAVFMLRIWYSV